MGLLEGAEEDGRFATVLSAEQMVAELFFLEGYMLSPSALQKPDITWCGRGRWFRAVLFESGSLFLPLLSDLGGYGPVLLEGCGCLYRTVRNLPLSKDMAG